jgi:hypothetical protein
MSGREVDGAGVAGEDAIEFGLGHFLQCAGDMGGGVSVHKDVEIAQTVGSEVGEFADRGVVGHIDGGAETADF